MNGMFLTAYNGSILGPIAKALGWIMDKIYLFFANVLGIENIALTIIVFTVLIYLCMFPLTYKQQKFSVLTKKMQPELKAVQEKYKGKKDNASMQAQQEETQMIYDKYGISPTGSCVQLLIQTPIFFALYRVFYNVPAYISSVKNVFAELVNGIMTTDGYAETMKTVFDESGLKNVAVDFMVDTSSTEGATQMSNYIVDVLYKLSSSGWETVANAFPNLTDSVNSVVAKLEQINYLFMLNISDTPWNLIKTGWGSKQYLLAFCALLIPIISYVTQMMNIKLMPQSGDANDQMAQQMKTMNLMMPLMSLVICFTVPVGLGLYWIMGAVVRFVQQFFLNKHFEKINLDDIIEKNKEKAAAKKEKRGIRQAQIYEAATMNTKRTMASKAMISEEYSDSLDKAQSLRDQAQPGTLASKANMVKEFNTRNNK